LIDKTIGRKTIGRQVRTFGRHAWMFICKLVLNVWNKLTQGRVQPE